MTGGISPCRAIGVTCSSNTQCCSNYCSSGKCKNVVSCSYKNCENQNPGGCSCGSVKTTSSYRWCCASKNYIAASQSVCKSWCSGTTTTIKTTTTTLPYQSCSQQCINNLYVNGGTCRKGGTCSGETSIGKDSCPSGWSCCCKPNTPPTCSVICVKSGFKDGTCRTGSCFIGETYKGSEGCSNGFCCCKGTTTTTIPSSCSKTDSNEVNTIMRLMTVGTCTDSTGKKYTDVCVSSDRLQEYRCSGTNCVWTQYMCSTECYKAYGYQGKCSGGQCVCYH